MIKGAKRLSRNCQHCGSTYMPGANNQKFCFNCLGPEITSGKGVRYAGAIRLSKYGVSYPEWVEMHERFGGLCWICKDKDIAVLDHDHVTGKPRGALCNDCNVNLHWVEKDGWINLAQNYLEGNF